MNLDPVAVGTAWMALVILAIQASFGLLRTNRRILRRSHIVLGVVLAPVTLVHAWISMRAVPARFTHAVGLRLATTALLLLGVQLMLGVILIRPPQSSRSFRRLHLAMGLVIVSLASAHVLLSR
jgi:hypothetical protein